MSTACRAAVIGAANFVAAADLVGLDIAPREVAAIPAAITLPAVASSRPPPGSAEERDRLLSVLAGTGENIALTARELGVSRVTLYRMMRRHAIVPSRGFNAPPGAAEAGLDDTLPHTHSTHRA